MVASDHNEARLDAGPAHNMPALGASWIWSGMENEQGKEKVQVPCEVYSRIVGYLRPVDNWGEAKQHEFAERRVYDDDLKPHSELIR